MEKVSKVIDFIVNDRTENATQVKVVRDLINLILQDGTSRAYDAVLKKLNEATEPLEITTCVMKFLALS